jgi:DNA-binding transcriptional ArsR family regulator
MARLAGILMNIPMQPIPLEPSAGAPASRDSSDSSVLKGVGSPKVFFGHSAALPAIGLKAVCILRVLASSTLPLGVRELMQRTGLKRSTLYYWLSKLVAWGAVERLSKPHTPYQLYRINELGLWVLNLYESKQAFESIQSYVRTKRAGPFELPLSFVVDGNPTGFREAGLRFLWSPLKAFLSRALKLNLPRRVRRVVVYTKLEGGRWTVHVDFATRLPRGEVLEGKGRVLREKSLFLFACAVLAAKYAGWTSELLVGLVKLLEPRVV